jgi:hypothetical protein
MVEYDADSRRAEIEDIGGREVNGVFFRSLGRSVVGRLVLVGDLVDTKAR